MASHLARFLSFEDASVLCTLCRQSSDVYRPVKREKWHSMASRCSYLLRESLEINLLQTPSDDPRVVEIMRRAYRGPLNNPHAPDVVEYTRLLVDTINDLVAHPALVDFVTLVVHGDDYTDLFRSEWRKQVAQKSPILLSRVTPEYSALYTMFRCIY